MTRWHGGWAPRIIPAFSVRFKYSCTISPAATPNFTSQITNFFFLPRNICTHKFVNPCSPSNGHIVAFPLHSICGVRKPFGMVIHNSGVPIKLPCVAGHSHVQAAVTSFARNAVPPLLLQFPPARRGALCRLMQLSLTIPSRLPRCNL